MQENDTMEFIMEFFAKKKQETIRRYKQLNEFVIKGQTLFVGSSLMEQFPINELQQTLDQNSIIYNRGVSGFVTQELLACMEECIFELEPSKLFINIGTNDIGSPGYKKEKLLVNYNQLLNQIKIRLPQCKVYVMAYYPVNAKANFAGISEDDKKELFQTRTNPALLEANAAIKELAQTYQYEYIDVNSGLMDNEGNLKKEFTIEGIHLWPNAYSIIFNILKMYL